MILITPERWLLWLGGRTWSDGSGDAWRERTFLGSKFLTVWTNVAGMSALQLSWFSKLTGISPQFIFIDKVVTETASSHLNLKSRIPPTLQSYVLSPVGLWRLEMTYLWHLMTLSDSVTQSDDEVRSNVSLNAPQDCCKVRLEKSLFLYSTAQLWLKNKLLRLIILHLSDDSPWSAFY